MTQQIVNTIDYLDSSNNEKVLSELCSLVLEAGNEDLTVLKAVYGDIVKLFSGGYPGFKASNTRYHNLEHTNAVVLASARMLHGLALEGRKIPSSGIALCIIAGLFHDTGLIQTEDDNSGTGAKYTIGHEERSIDLMRMYLNSRGLGKDEIEDCVTMVLHTMLFKPLQEIPFRGEGVKLLGHVLGTADLVSQMADRYYLEKLPLLFLEFKEGGLKHYSSELDLFAATEDFYQNVFMKRIFNDFEGIAGALKSHYKSRCGVDYDPYMESVRKNIAYLRSLHESCEGKYECYLEKLRRGNIINEIYG